MTSATSKLRKSIKPAIVALIGLGIALLGPPIAKWVVSEPIRGWPTVMGEVVLLDRTSRMSDSETYRVAYTYAVDGERWCSDGRSLAEGEEPVELCRLDHRVNRESYVDWRIGGPIEVAYQADSPGESRPVQQARRPGLYWAIGGFLLFAGGLTIFVVWRGPLGVNDDMDHHNSKQER